VVAVGVTYERAVVVGVVLGPDAWFVQDLGSLADSRVEEGAHRGAIRRGERDVRLTEAIARRVRTEPEVRLRGAAEADHLTEVHDARAADRCQDCVVEPSAAGNVSALD